MALAFASQRSFDDLGTPLFDVTFCVLDIETTGSGPESLGITEIGAVKVRGGEVIGTFQTLVNPGAPIPAAITVLTGITQSMVIRAPTLEQVIPSFLEFLSDSVVVGHNVRFDLGFLNAATNRFGYGQIPNLSVDTLALARRLVRTEVRNLRLGTLAAYLRSPVTPDHRALADAQATSHVLHSLLDRAGSLGVTALEDLLQLPRAKGSPHYGKLHMARDLPRVPGVYLFYDRDGDVIYVGKAKNLRTRVSSYFYGDERRSIGDLLRRLEDVDYIVCSGDLEASITEQRLIHAHRPVFNRVNRPPKANHYLSLTVEVFPRLSLTRSINHRSALVLGPFRSHQQAQLVQAALWDSTKIRRCSGKPGSKSAPCASAQLGFSFCPCTGDLVQDDYVSVIAQIVDGVETDPALLLDPLAERIRHHASQLRYEEAGWVRDRHRALALAIDRRQQWHSLTTAGRFEAEHPDGECAVVDSGRLLVSWRSDSNRPFVPIPVQEPEQTVPPDVAAAEEARIIWKWITQPGILITAGSRPLPPPEIPMLEVL